MNSRKLKIYSRFQKSSNRLIIVPEIRLRGKWLMNSASEKEKW
ncbi:hypothetical protein [Chryseobacterium mucoviscidosis]|nr:hypothetical protein [Chryseobacterium mucoviscidosis]